MGIKQLCCGKVDEVQTISDSTVNSVFQIILKDKVKTLSFAYSYKNGRYSLKYKKRILVTTEGGKIHLFSYYLGNLIFLLCSYTVDTNYKILDCAFLSKTNSNKFSILLEDMTTGAVDILIMRVNKLFDTENVVVIRTKINIEPEVIESPDNELHNKKLIEKFMNSPNCSDNHSDNSDKGSTSILNEELVVSRNYDDEFMEEFMKFNKKNHLKGEFNKEISLLKYGYYSFELKLLIDDESKEVQFTRVSDYYIYIYSEKSCVIKVFKVKPNLKTYSCVYRINYKVNIKAYQTIFPSKSCLFIFDGIFLTKYTEGQMAVANNFNDLYVKKDIDVLKFTKIYYYEVKLEKFDKDGKKLKVCNFITTGLCFKKTKEEETQFLSLISFEDREGCEYKNSITLMSVQTPSVSEITYGPFNNGPIVTCHIDGSLLVWNSLDLVISKKIKVFDGFPISGLTHEPNNLTICHYEGLIKAIHIIGKETEHFYNEDLGMGLQRLVRQTRKYS
jgi:hypothetical protein